MTSSKQRSVLTFSIVMIGALMLSSCQRALSDAPVATTTPIATGVFVSPIASVENPMEMIEEFARQTEAAQTAVAGGGTPAAAGTPAANTTPQAGATTAVPAVASPTATVAAAISTPTNANAAATPATVSMSVPPSIAAGSEYILREGEYPYCIARRYNVDPDALLKASGLTSPDVYYAGLKLVIPQSGPFPGQRWLKAHPTTYTVQSGSETVYSIACQFGDVDPNAIASANGISASAKLTVGQNLQIP